MLAAALAAGCEAPQDESPTLGFSVSPGLSIPAPEDLKSRIDDALRHPDGSKGYVMQSSAWTPVRLPTVTKRANATVRSYNASESAAFVEVVVPEHKTSVLQIWRFQGGKWTDDVRLDPNRRV